MKKSISNTKLQNIYFSDDDLLKENIDINILKEKLNNIEKKEKKKNKKNKQIKFYKKIIDYQKNEIIKNQDTINKQNKKFQNKGGSCNNKIIFKDIIKELFKFNNKDNFYDIKRKGLFNKLLFIISNIIFTILLFIVTYNLIYIYRNKKFNYISIILVILIYILYRLINIFEENICNNNNLIYNLDTYIKNLNNYINSNELDKEKKEELLGDVNKYISMFDKMNIKNLISNFINDFIMYLPFIIFIILFILIDTKLINIIILTIIVTLILIPYINLYIYYNINNKYIKNIGYIFEKLLIIYISYLIINIVYNKYTLLDNYNLMLFVIEKIRL